MLDAIPAGGLLHIAAHGHHEPDNPLFSGVLLADGLLYGYDVAPNPTLPAQVVLSSCDVGRTDDRPGSEPLGLVAALLRSGVSTVIAGTSRVSDQVAAAVMAAYHQRLECRPGTGHRAGRGDRDTAGSGRRSGALHLFRGRAVSRGRPAPARRWIPAHRLPSIGYRRSSPHPTITPGALSIDHASGSCSASA